MNEVHKIARFTKTERMLDGNKYSFWQLENEDGVLGPWVKEEKESEIITMKREALVLVCEDQKLPVSKFDATKMNSKQCWGEMKVTQVRKIYPGSFTNITPTISWSPTRNTIEE